MTGRDVHRLGTTALSLSMAILGIVLLVQAFAAGVSLARGLLGVLFLAAGSGRLYVLARRRDDA